LNQAWNAWLFIDSGFLCKASVTLRMDLIKFCSLSDYELFLNLGLIFA
jgi:hypothetical protein